MDNLTEKIKSNEEIRVGDYVKVSVRSGVEIVGQVTCVSEGALKIYPHTGNLEEYEIIDGVVYYTDWENDYDKSLSRVKRIERIERRPESVSNPWKKDDGEVYPWSPQE